MSPVASSGNNHVGRAAAVALVGIIVLAIALGLATLAFRNTNSPELGLGDQVFQAGRTDRLSAEIADRGPIFYGDVSGRRCWVPCPPRTSASETSAICPIRTPPVWLRRRT